MTDETKKPEKQIDNLELNRDTLAHLTERETEQVQGGAFGRSDARALPTTSSASALF